MRYYYCYLLKMLREREHDPKEFGKIAQDIVAIDLKLCGHKILEYSLVGKSDIETEFKGDRYVFQVKSSEKLSEINVRQIKDELKAKIGKKILIFFDISFPARLMCFDLDNLPNANIIPVFKEDKLSEDLNKNLSKAVQRYYEFYKQYYRAEYARKLVKNFIGTS